MAESRAYEQVKLYSDGFIKFISTDPKQYYLKKIKYYLSKVLASKKEVDSTCNNNLKSLADYIDYLNSEDGTNLKINEPESTFLFAYLACNIAWMEAGITYKSYTNEIPARLNLNQAVNIGYYYKDAYGKYIRNSTEAPTFFNEMDNNLLSMISDTSMQILLGSSYYGEYPVIDIDNFNKHIHNTIEKYYEEVAKKSKHNMKNSYVPNKKFHEKIAEGFNEFNYSLSNALKNLDFTKENPLAF